MSRFHHMIKTFGPLEVRQPFPGIYIWKNQHNQFFLVDHTGTRRITQPEDREPSQTQAQETDEQPVPGRAERRRRSSGQVGIQVYLDRDPIDNDRVHTA